MNRELWLATTCCVMFPTFLMYYLSVQLIDKTNVNNNNLIKVILLEEKISQLEEKIEDLEDFKTSYYQNSFNVNSWDTELLNSSDDD